MEPIILIAAAIVAFIVYQIYAGLQDSTKAEVAKKHGKFITGHPDISTPCLTTISLSPTDVIISKIDEFGKTEEQLCTIPLAQIKTATVEDRSTMESRVAASRLLLVGVFAFAAKKKEVHPDFYSIVSWSDGRFDFNTIFEYSGPNANTLANKSCNEIVNACRKLEPTSKT